MLPVHPLWQCDTIININIEKIMDLQIYFNRAGLM